MDRPITRRDVLHGLAVAGAGALAGSLLPAAASAAEPAGGAADYPPAWTGLRGSAPGTFETAHALRDGRQWPSPEPDETDYDLVVVGAGISGLAAAYFYRERHPQARILLLDNHDDFGGHARRNEFVLDGKLHLMNGGTAEIDSPRPYSAVADGLLRKLGIDVEAIAGRIGQAEFFYQVETGQRGQFFDRETFGADCLVAGKGERPWFHFLHRSPLPARARADLVRLFEGDEDYLPGLRSEQKKLLLSKISFERFLADYARAHPMAILALSGITKGEWTVGIDAIAAIDVWGYLGDETPGMRGLRLAPGGTSFMGPSPAGYASTGGSYKLHFPDGNATIARALVRSLVPAIAPAGPIEDLVTARFDYAQLDRAGAPVRLRLRSTVVHARNVEGGVRVDYVERDRPRSTRARACVLACYNMVIPHLCPELPERQKAALHQLVKDPLVYVSVAIANARAFERLGVRAVEAPGMYFSSIHLNPTQQIGAYRNAASVDEPTLVLMQALPCQKGLSEDDQARAGRAQLLATDFETFERRIRDQLGRVLGPGGFEPARDILAITVNRWPHGYASEFNPLWDQELPEDLRPHVIGRARCGAITIANSDAGASAYTDCAIDQAHRAVTELFSGAGA